MNSIVKNRKVTAFFLLLMFLFTSILPANIVGWSNRAEAATNAELQAQQVQIVDAGGELQYKGATKVSFGNKPNVKVSKIVTPTGTENDNGQAIVYTVEETVSAALATHYDMNNIKYVKTDDGYDIINTMKQQTFSILGNKEWVNEAGAKIDAPKDQQIEIALFRDDVIVDTTTASALTDWKFSFTDLPRFALEAEPTADGYAHLYDYRIEELPIDGYIPMYEVTRDNGDVHAVVTNMVCEGQNISVSKTVEGNAPNEQFRFVLKVKSTVNVWDAMKVYQKLLLDEAWEEAVEERDEAQKAVQIAENAFKTHAAEITTSSAYWLIMAKDVETTSGSAYGFIAVNRYGEIVSDGTTGSSYNFMWRHNKVGAGKETGIVQKVINAIKALAEQFANMPGDTNLLKALYSEVTSPSALGFSSTPSAVGFVKEDAEYLFHKQQNLLDAEALVQATTEAALKFVEENVTTPTAIKLILPGTGEVVYDSTGKTPNADGFYEVPFELFAGSTFSVNIASTTGAQISYEIVEIYALATNYKGTEIYVDNALISDNALSTGKQTLSKGADAVRFHNIYAGPDTPWYPPYIPEDDEPEEEPEPTPKDPEDPNEPPVTPGTEIPNEPEEIPEDVVPTGDTNRAVPYMVMMLIGFFGMWFSRRKSN